MIKSKKISQYTLNIFIVMLITIGSVMTYTDFSINEVGLRGSFVEIGSSLRPILENMVLILLAYRLTHNKSKHLSVTKIWGQIWFYSFVLSMTAMSVVLTRLNISNFIRSLFPVTFLTNSFAIAVLLMAFLNKFILSLGDKNKNILWWAGLISLSVVPTLIWVMKIPDFPQFQFGTILWGSFVLLTFDRLNKMSNSKAQHLVNIVGLMSIGLSVVLICGLNLAKGHFLLFQPGFIAVRKLAMLPSNFFAFGIALYIFYFLIKVDLISKLSFSFLFGATLFNTHFIMIDSFWNNLWKTTFWGSQSIGRMLISVFIVVVVVTMTVSLIEYVRRNATIQLIDRKPKISLTVILAFVVACFSNIILLLTNSLFNVEYIFRINDVRTQLMLLNVLLFWALAMLVYVIVNRILVSSGVLLAVLGAFSFGDYQKIISRNEPVMPIDITSNLSNISELSDLVNIWLVLFLVVLIVLIIAMTIWYEHKASLARPFNWIHRICSGIISVGFLGFFMIKLPLVPSSVVTWKAKDHTMTNNVMSKEMKYLPHPGAIWWDFKANGPAVTFVSRFRIPIMDKPENYSKSKITSLENKYGRIAADINKTRTNNIKNDVVVYILSESFSNPNRVPGIKMPQNPIPYTDQIKQDNTSGIMNSYGYGGGTADIEFEALPGMSLNNFNPALSTPYVELMPRLNYMPSVLDLFGTKNAIHPFQPGLYNRVSVFKQFGFSKFYNTKDPNKVSYTNKLQGSPYISDMSAYKELEKVMNENKQGQFIQLSTMQNHMPYNKNEYKNNYPISGPFSGDSLSKLKTYTEGIHQSDQALKYLISKVNQEKRHVTLVFYGDHLPGAYAWSKNNNENMDKYDSELHQTDYFIYSNYTNKKVKKAIVAPYMFTPMMLDQTNSKVSAYYALLTKCLEILPAGEREKFMESSGKQITEDNLTKKQKKLLQDYKMIQYDITAGNHYLNRNSEFFKVNQ